MRVYSDSTGAAEAVPRRYQSDGVLLFSTRVSCSYLKKKKKKEKKIPSSVFPQPPAPPLKEGYF